MNTRLVTAILLLLAATLATAPQAAAQTAAPLAGGVVSSAGQQVIVQPPGFAETALASCAGGAMIGYLAVLATGAATPVATAALFCGLSVAATTASNVAVWTWRETRSLIY